MHRNILFRKINDGSRDGSRVVNILKPDFHSYFLPVASEFFHMGHVQCGETNRITQKYHSLSSPFI